MQEERDMDFNFYLSRLKNAWNKSILPKTKQGNTSIKRQSEEGIKLSKKQPKKERQKKPKEKKQIEKKKSVQKSKKISSKKQTKIDIKKKRKTSVKKPRTKVKKLQKQKIVKTPLRAQYMKQRARIQAIVKRARKEGLYLRNEDLLDILPKRTPRRVTQSMFNKLKSIKPRDIHKRGYYLDIDTGEIIGGIEYIYNRRKEKREAKNIAKKVFKKKLENRDIDIIELPIIDSVEMLLERIQNMHSIYGHEYANLKSICIYIINANLSEHPKEYREYIKNELLKISECLEVLLAPSNQETIEIYSEELVRVLNMNIMSLELNDMLVDYVYE